MSVGTDFMSQAGGAFAAGSLSDGVLDIMEKTLDDIHCSRDPIIAAMDGQKNENSLIMR